MGDAEDELFVKFWGVRGSLPVAGAQYQEFGGNTPCVEVRCGERLFIIDAGTGIVQLGAELASRGPPTEIDLLLSHLHVDHIVGLPFFRPALMADRRVRVHCGNLRGMTAEEAFERLFSPPLFPITLSQLPGAFEHHGFTAGEDLGFSGGYVATTTALNHPGGATGFRLEHRGRSVCYISDMEHSEPWPPPELADFVRGASLMIYDGMFSETEYVSCRGWGHSTWQKGISLCQAASVERLAIFHLHPQHDDTYLRKVEAEIQAQMPGAFVAREGLSLSFPPAT